MKKVLLAVDDRPDNLFVYEQLLAEYLPELEFLTAESGPAGLSMVEDHPVDCALIDVQMPGMSGIDMCRLLKGSIKTRGIHVILVTAHQTTTEMRVMGLEAGADDFIAKPIDNVELIAKIKVLLRLKSLEDSLRREQDRLESAVRQRTREVLEAERRYRTLVKASPVGIFRTDAEGSLLYVNEGWSDLARLTPVQVHGKKWFSFVHPEQREEIEDKWHRAVAEGLPFRAEYRLMDHGPWDIWVFGQSAVEINEKCQVVGHVGTITDITERKDREEQIKTALAEKNALLHEVHHRVRNNLQIISSLIELQVHTAGNQEVVQALRDSQNRIHAMALVHEALFDLDQVDAVDFKTYISKMVVLSFRTYQADERYIRPVIDMEKMALSLERAGYMGLVINELVANSLKYAFPVKEGQGMITIRARKKEEDWVEIVVADNGVGLPIDFDWKKTSTLGLQLVKTLVEEQVEGSIECHRQGGTVFTIGFRSGISRAKPGSGDRLDRKG